MMVSIQIPSPQAQVPIQELQSTKEECPVGIFERIQEALLYCWEFLKTGFRIAFANTGFWLFRGLEYISPVYALRAETITLRIMNMWNAMKDAWKEEKVGKTTDGLLIENAELQFQVRTLGEKSRDRDQLVRECDVLKTRNEFLERVNENAVRVNQEKGLQVQAVGEERDLLFQANQRLKQERDDFQKDLEKEREKTAPLTELCEQLETQLREARRAEEDLRAEALPTRAFFQQVKEIRDSCVQIKAPTELDHQLEQLLPLLLGQLERAQTLLDQVKEDLEPLSSVGIAVKSFERILSQLSLGLKNIPQAFKRHSEWQTHIHQLMQIPLERELY